MSSCGRVNNDSVWLVFSEVMGCGHSDPLQILDPADPETDSTGCYYHQPSAAPVQTVWPLHQVFNLWWRKHLQLFLPHYSAVCHFISPRWKSMSSQTLKSGTHTIRIDRADGLNVWTVGESKKDKHCFVIDFFFFAARIYYFPKQWKAYFLNAALTRKLLLSACFALLNCFLPWISSRRTPIITLRRQGGSERMQRLRIDMLVKQRGKFLSTGAV